MRLMAKQVLARRTRLRQRACSFLFQPTCRCEGGNEMPDTDAPEIEFNIILLHGSALPGRKVYIAYRGRAIVTGQNMS